jgi:hypothetical protein
MACHEPASYVFVHYHQTGLILACGRRMHRIRRATELLAQEKDGPPTPRSEISEPAISKIPTFGEMGTCQ